MVNMKVIIAGGRDFKDYDLLEENCDRILANIEVEEIVSGGQVTTDPVTGEKYGADYLGELYAKDNWHKVKIFPANWNKLGKRAGPIRNAQMAEYADMLIAFWDKRSRGTQSMIYEAYAKGLIVHIVNY